MISLPPHPRRKRPAAVASSGTTAIVRYGDEKPEKFVGGSNAEVDLIQFIPTKTLQAMKFPRVFSKAVSSLAFLPQYRFTARPLNRLLGGPTQPMSSSLTSAFVTDMLWHQISAVIALALYKRSAAPIFAFRPNPFKSTASTIFFGAPIGLYKMGQFKIHSDIQNVALQVVGDNFKLSLEVVKLLKLAMNPFVPEQKVGQKMLHFIETHSNELPVELTIFANAIGNGELIQINAGRGLLRAAEAYGKTGDDVAFAEVIKRLQAIVPLQPWQGSAADDNKLLWRDAIKVGILAGVLLAEWASWGISLAGGNETAKVQSQHGRSDLISPLLTLVILTVCVNFAVTRLKIPI